MPNTILTKEEFSQVIDKVLKDVKARKREPKIAKQLRQKVNDIDQEIAELRAKQKGYEHALALALGQDV
jgi:hypothetical protein